MTHERAPGAPGIAATEPGEPGVAATGPVRLPAVAATEPTRLPAVAATEPGIAATEPGIAATEPGEPGVAAAEPVRLPAERLLDLLKGPWPHDGEPLLDTLVRLEPTPDEGRTLRAFVVAGRLTGLPARHARRDILLRFLLERIFPDDRNYSEPEVNAALARFHPDTAALRRYLVDEGYVNRESGRYRRAGPGA